MKRVIGSPEGFFGDKFEQLIDSTPLVEAAGAFVPETVGISQDVIDDTLVASGLPSIAESGDLPADSPHLANMDKRLAIPEALQDELLGVAEGLAQVFNGPLILRSSGRGDALGVGVYDSRVHGATRQSVVDSFIAVVGSYFTEQAVNYRGRLGLPPGFGMLMQPIVGEHTRVRDRHSFLRDDYDTMDMFDQEHCTLPAFAPLVSGNVKIGTPRSIGGLLRLEEGMGSAVNKRTAPIIDLAEGAYDDSPLSFVNGDYSNDRIWLIQDDAQGGNHLVEVDGVWKLTEPEGRHGYILGMSKELTLADLRGVVGNIHRNLGAPCYLEFAAVTVDEQERIYVLQVGKLAPREAGGDKPDYEFVNPDEVLADRLQAQNDVISTDPFGKIVNLSRWEQHDDLYLFDSQEEAKEGYLLIYNSRATHMGNRIDLRKLKNVRGLVELESLEASRLNGTAEEHLIGYSEQLGIPLLSIKYGADEARRSLMGIDPEEFRVTRQRPAIESFGGLSIRSGRFRVVGDPASGTALVAKC